MAMRGLTRGLIVDRALALLDEVGLDGLNMRALADRLQVKAPALYWHVANKQELVDEMATALWRDVQAAAPLDLPDWHEGMIGFALALRRTLLAHRDGAKLFSGTYLTDVSILEAQERPLGSLLAAGMTLEKAVEISGVLYAFTVGSAIEEQGVVQAGDDRYDLANRERRLDPERFPLVTAAGRLSFPDPAARFERSVRNLVAAFDSWGDEPSTRSR